MLQFLIVTKFTMSTSSIFSHDSFLVGIIIIDPLKVFESLSNMANFTNIFCAGTKFQT